MVGIGVDFVNAHFMVFVCGDSDSDVTHRNDAPSSSSGETIDRELVWDSD